MANALLLELRVRCVSGHDGDRVFLRFVANPRTVRLSRSRGRNWPAGFALDEERCFRLIRRRQSTRVGFNPTDVRESTVRTTRQLSITLPNDMADALRHKVSAGEYASESEVIREGLRTLFARDRAVEAWLQAEVAAAYDAAVSDPARTVSAKAVRDRLAGEQARSV